MNIVIVNHYAGGPSFGMEFRPYYMAKEWAALGHKVIVVGATYSHLRSKQPGGKSIRIETTDGVKYIWVPTNTYKGNGLGRILSFLNFLYGLYFKVGRVIEKEFVPDLIIASSTYPLDLYPLRRLANKYNAKLCYEVHDLWPLSPQELGGYSKYHPFVVVMQMAENFGYQESDFIVSMLPAALPHMIEHGLDPKKFHYIPNGFDKGEWDKENIAPLPKEHVEAIAELKSKHSFLVAYAGNHGIANSLDSFLDAAALLKSNVAIVLVGDGPEKNGLIKMANEKKITNAYFLPAIKKKSIPALLEQFDALYIGLKNESLFRFGISPNKMIDYMMAGKPIIQAINAGNNMVKEYGCGIDVTPENPASIALGIETIESMHASDRATLGANGRKAALAHHDYKVLSENFIKAYKKNS
jgi:glycosyltransferase involved in cell wall biosynthesis